MGRDVAFIHTTTAVWVWSLWMLYPVCRGMSEGGNFIAPDSEFIFYGILDCVLIPVTTALLLFRHWTIGPARLGPTMRTSDEPIRRHGLFRTEKPLSNDQSYGEAHTSPPVVSLLLWRRAKLLLPTFDSPPNL